MSTGYALVSLFEIIVGIVAAILFGKEICGRIKYKELFSGFGWGMLMGAFSWWFWLIFETGKIKKTLFECKHKKDYKNHMTHELKLFWCGYWVCRIVLALFMVPLLH